MASPSHRSQTKNAIQSTGATTITGTEPTGAASGDIIAIGLMLDRTSGSNPGTVSPPSGGYSVVAGFPFNATSVFDYYVWWARRSGSALSCTPTWTTGLGGFGYAELRVIAVSGAVASGNPIDSVTIGTVATTTQPDPPANTLLTANTLVYAWIADWAGWTSAPTAPTNYTGLSDNGGLYDSSIAWRQLAAAGSENPGTFGAADASDTAFGFTLAFASVGSQVVEVRRSMVVVPGRVERRSPPFWPPSFVKLSDSPPTAPSVASPSPARSSERYGAATLSGIALLPSGARSTEFSGAVVLGTIPVVSYGADVPAAAIPGAYHRLSPPFWPPTNVPLATTNSALVTILLPASARSSERGGAPSAPATLSPSGNRSSERAGAPAGVPGLSPSSSRSQEHAGACIGTPTLSLAACRSSERGGAENTNAFASPSGARTNERAGVQVLIPTVVSFPCSSRTGERAGASTFIGIALTPAACRSSERAGAENMNASMQPSGVRPILRSGAEVSIPSLLPSGARTSERAGASTFSGIVCSPSGSRTGERGGATTVIGAVFTNPTSSRSGERFGASTFSGIVCSPSAARTGERFGTVVATSIVLVSPAPARSAERSGASTFTGIALAPAGSRSSSSAGAENTNATPLPAGSRPSTQAGALTSLAFVQMAPARASSPSGIPVLAVTLPAAGSRSTSIAGASQIFASVVVFPSVARTGERRGSPTLAAVVAPSGRSSGQRVGSGFLGVVLAPAGGRPQTRVPPPTLSVLITTHPASARSHEFFGSPALSVTTPTRGPFVVVSIVSDGPEARAVSIEEEE